jgi:hypothetical protein
MFFQTITIGLPKLHHLAQLLLIGRAGLAAIAQPTKNTVRNVLALAKGKGGKYDNTQSESPHMQRLVTNNHFFCGSLYFKVVGVTTAAILLGDRYDTIGM